MTTEKIKYEFSVYIECETAYLHAEKVNGKRGETGQVANFIYIMWR